MVEKGQHVCTFSQERLVCAFDCAVAHYSCGVCLVDQYEEIHQCFYGNVLALLEY